MNPQEYNRYSYVLNSPMNYIDPTGHYCLTIGVDTAACAYAEPPSSTPDPVDSQILDATVQICVMSGNSCGRGHGVIIGNNKILTTNHFSTQGDYVDIYDGYGNSICSRCGNRAVSTFELSTGDFADIAVWEFEEDHFASYSSLPIYSGNESDLVGEVVGLVTFQSANTNSGIQSNVVWGQASDTAYVALNANAKIPTNENGAFSGLVVDYSVSPGSSGGAAVIVSNGQPMVIGVNSSRSEDQKHTFVSFFPQ